MGDREIADSGALWADAFFDVPLEAVEPLFRRVLRGRTSPHPPAVGDFRAAWNDWDYWAEVNADPEAKAPVRGQLPAPPEHQDGPGVTAYRVQGQRIEDNLPMVLCECVNRYGNHNTATLSPDKTRWICALDQCAFSWPLEDVTVPIRQRAAKVRRVGAD